MHNTTAGDSNHMSMKNESGLRRQIMPYARNIPTPLLILKAWLTLLISINWSVMMKPQEILR